MVFVIHWSLQIRKVPSGSQSCQTILHPLRRWWFCSKHRIDVHSYWHIISWPGPQEVSRLLLLAAGAWADQVHEEILVYNQGFWSKDPTLWKEIQKADWKDVILKDTFKKALQKDVYGFFTSETIYKELGIPWKVCTSVFERLNKLNFWRSVAWSCMGFQVSSNDHILVILFNKSGQGMVKQSASRLLWKLAEIRVSTPYTLNLFRVCLSCACSQGILFIFLHRLERWRGLDGGRLWQSPTASSLRSRPRRPWQSH